MRVGAEWTSRLVHFEASNSAIVTSSIEKQREAALRHTISFPGSYDVTIHELNGCIGSPGDQPLPSAAPKVLRKCSLR